jgi:hypothetical protein
MPQKKISTTKREAYVRFRAMGLTQQESASRSGMCRRSAVTLEGEAAICRQILELRERLGAPDAVDVLRAIMNDPEAKNSDRITAAKALLAMPMIPDDVLPDGDAVVGGEIHVHLDRFLLEDAAGASGVLEGPPELANSS